MQLRSLPLLAGLVAAFFACLDRSALADSYFLENWSADASIAGVPIAGRFIYDVTTGGVVGDTTSISGFCASGACGFQFLSTNAVTLSGSGAASVDVYFQDANFATAGAHQMKFAINGVKKDVFGVSGLVRHTTGGLSVSAVPLLLERWTAGASLGGVPITGNFFYDPAAGSVVQDMTSIPGFCAPGACGFSFLSDRAVTLSAPGRAAVQLYFQDPTFGKIGTHLLGFGVNGDVSDAFGVAGRALRATGGLDVLPPALASAPSPAPGFGSASLLALACAMLWTRRLQKSCA